VVDSNQSFEQALARTEADAEQTLKAANAVIVSLRRLRGAAKTGNLKDLHSAMAAADGSLATLRQQFSNAKEGWNFDEASYFGAGHLSQELIAAGQKINVNISNRDERLYCYPSLVRVAPNERVVYIDRKREPRVRPSVLAARLRELQRKPSRFSPQPFLQALHAAYQKAVATRPAQLVSTAPVVPLLEIYELLTLLPGQSREYTREEFSRDIYLLHQSGVVTTRSGAKVSFPASSGLRSTQRVLSVITESGEQRRYFGISFTEATKEG
jgi:hypothetical protein